MRTDKHKLKPLNLLQETQFLEVMRAYQNEKNYFSTSFLLLFLILKSISKIIVPIMKSGIT